MDLEALSGLLKVLEKSRVTMFEIEEEETGRLLRLRKEGPAASGTASAAVVPTVGTETPARHRIRVEAMFVGRFYSPDRPVSAGDLVVEDQILGSVESMRLMNPVSAPSSGIIAALCIEDGQPVEYGQLLYEIDAGNESISEAGG